MIAAEISNITILDMLAHLIKKFFYDKVELPYKQ